MFVHCTDITLSAVYTTREKDKWLWSYNALSLNSILFNILLLLYFFFYYFVGISFAVNKTIISFSLNIEHQAVLLKVFECLCIRSAIALLRKSEKKKKIISTFVFVIVVYSMRKLRFYFWYPPAKGWLRTEMKYSGTLWKKTYSERTNFYSFFEFWIFLKKGDSSFFFFAKSKSAARKWRNTKMNLKAQNKSWTVFHFPNWVSRTQKQNPQNEKKIATTEDKIN